MSLLTAERCPIYRRRHELNEATKKRPPTDARATTRGEERGEAGKPVFPSIISSSLPPFFSFFFFPLFPCAIDDRRGWSLLMPIERPAPNS